jgi:hypothetical protein
MRTLELPQSIELAQRETEALARQLRDPFRARMLECFPHIYAELAAEPNRESAPITLRGFEVPPGWRSLVERLSGEIADVVGRQPVEKRPRYRVAQVNERFGRLRVYMVKATLPEIEAAIEAAEGESVVTCEECGSRGRPRRHRSYVQVLCEVHDAGP